MDKTIEVVVVAMVVLVTAVTIVFMVRGQADSFSGFSDGQTMSSKCQLWAQRDSTKYEDNECSEIVGSSYTVKQSTGSASAA